MPFRPISPLPAVALDQAHQADVPSRRVEKRPRFRPVQPTTAQQSLDPSPPQVIPPSKEAVRPTRKHHVVDRSGPNWKNGDYIVGKGRPPRANQWKPNHSGNPRGPKPREKLDPETELDNAILAPFATVVNGTPEQTTLGLFAVNILKAKAAQKDRKAAEILLDLYRTRLRMRKPLEDGAMILPEEQEIIDALLDAAGWDALPAIRNERIVPDEQDRDDE